MSTSAALLLAAIAGLSVGSFLNVVVHRLPRGQSPAWPASHCPKCERPLRWHHNIPVVSWIALRGRCAFCGDPIALRYPMVEISTAIVWVLVVWLTPPGWLLASRLVLAGALVALFVIDLEHQILPNAITLPGIAAGLLFALVAPPGPIDALLGTAVGGGVLYAIAAGYYLLRREEGMGMGDVKMLAMIGAFLGWRLVLVTLVLASCAGSIVGLAVMATERGGLRYALPFGTFLAVGALAAMLVGERLLEWYLGLFPSM